MRQKVFITCAVTGAGNNYTKNPAVPITPQQIADAVQEAEGAGAAIAHIHVRDPDTGIGSRRTDLYADVLSRIRDKGCSIIVNFTAGMGGDLVIGQDDPYAFGVNSDLISQAERLVHVEALLPEICTLDCGSYNASADDVVYISTPTQIRQGAARIRAVGVKPELELFDLGHVRHAVEMIAAGAFEPPVMVQFCLGVPYAAPATTEALIAMRSLLPSSPEVIWSAFGVGAMQLPMVAQATILGGNVRVGLEDNIYLSRGKLATNGQLVERAATIVNAMGASVMGPDETRALLGLAAPQAGRA